MSLTGMDIVVLPDDDDKVKDLEPDSIGTDGVRFYVSETMWARIKGPLMALTIPEPSLAASDSGH